MCTTLPVSVVSHPSSITCGQARHNCFATHQLPMNGLVHNNAEYARDGKSARGLAVHKCIPVDQSQLRVVLLQPAPDIDTSTEHPALTNMACCYFHCGQCLHCFKSRPCFRHDNCHRGHHIPVNRNFFHNVCNDCNRRVCWPQDSLFDEGSVTR